MRLTDIQIRALKSPERGQKTYFDDNLRGFGVRVSQGGSKSFVVMYGRERNLKTLGRYPTLSLANARRLAKQVQVQALENSSTRSPVAPVSFSDARQRFLVDSKVRNKERTYQGYNRLLHRHFAFTESVDQLTRSSIMDAVEKLSTTPSEQQHAFVAIRVMMNWCVKRGFIDHSPVPPLSFRAPARSNVVADGDLSEIWKRTEEIGYPYGTIVRLLILTGQRRGEIASLRWSWLEDDLIVFPTGFTKNKREHRLPVSPLARQTIADIPRTGELLFPARGHATHPFNGWGKSKTRFDEQLTIAPYTLHDLRRTFSSNMARIGTPIHVTEKLLNHISGTVSGVAAVYNRYSYINEMRVAMLEHDDFLAQLASP